MNSPRPPGKISFSGFCASLNAVEHPLLALILHSLSFSFTFSFFLSLDILFLMKQGVVYIFNEI